MKQIGLQIFHYDKYNKFVFNVATKNHWREPSNYNLIERASRLIAKYSLMHKIRDVAVPMLGCGLGGLDRREVTRIMVEQFINHNNETIFYIYEQ